MEVMKIIGCSIKVKDRDKLAYLYTWKPLSLIKKIKIKREVIHEKWENFYFYL